MNNKELKKRCVAIEIFFEHYVLGLEPYIAKFWDFHLINVTGQGLRISNRLIFDAMHHYINDANRYKKEYGFLEKNDSAEPALIDYIKIGALTTYWLVNKSPIYDVNDEQYVIEANVDFAMFSGLTIAGINVMDARAFKGGRIYKQIIHVIAKGAATQDLLVPLYALLFEACPLKQ